jgi:hypothetical protein
MAEDEPAEETAAQPVAANGTAHAKSTPKKTPPTSSVLGKRTPGQALLEYVCELSRGLSDPDNKDKITDDTRFGLWNGQTCIDPKEYGDINTGTEIETLDEAAYNIAQGLMFMGHPHALAGILEAEKQAAAESATPAAAPEQKRAKMSKLPSK